MRSTFYRYLPWVFGITLGWLLVNPPSWLAGLGAAAWVVNGALCGLLLLSIVPLLILANLPNDLKIDMAPDSAVHGDLRAVARQLEALGFRPAGPAARVHVAPAAILLGFVHTKYPVYATVYRTETLPPKIGQDFVSILHGDCGGLTTTGDPAGATLADGTGEFRQVLPNADIAGRFKGHMAGLAFLNEKGIPPRAVSGDTLLQDLAACIRRQRGVFLASPLSASWVTFWRSATKQVPFIGLLGSQKSAALKVSRLLGAAG